MSVYKRAKSRFWLYDFVYQGRRHHGSTGQATESKARRVEERKRLEAALGHGARRAVPTLDAAAGEWWLAKGEHLRSASTLLPRLTEAVTLIGKDRLVNEITTSDVAAAIQRRRAKLVKGRTVAKNATVNRDIICTIRPILRRQRKLLNDGRGTPVHFPEIDWQELTLPEPKPKPRDFSPSEVTAFIVSLPPHWRDFALMQATYGCRLGEMFFAITDLDLSAGELRLRNRKGGDDHLLPLQPADVAMLRARAGRAVAAGLRTVWFRELKNGSLKALTYNAAKQALRRSMRMSGLHAAKGAKGSHDLRHHAAMQFLRATGDVRATQKLLGHAEMQSTLVYAHCLVGDVKAGLDKVSRLVPEADQETREISNEDRVLGYLRTRT